MAACNRPAECWACPGGSQEGFCIDSLVLVRDAPLVLGTKLWGRAIGYSCRLGTTHSVCVSQTRSGTDTHTHSEATGNA